MIRPGEQIDAASVVHRIDKHRSECMLGKVLVKEEDPAMTNPHQSAPVEGTLAVGDHQCPGTPLLPTQLLPIRKHGKTLGQLSNPACLFPTPRACLLLVLLALLYSC